MVRSRQSSSRQGSIVVERLSSKPSASPERKESNASPKGRTLTNNVRVMVRVRPFNTREILLSKEQGVPLKCVVQMEGKVTSMLDPEDEFDSIKSGMSYEYDECFWSIPAETCEHFPMSSNGFATQDHVYDNSGKFALDNAWESYNTCIFAYGQTGSGKSYSMLGSSEGEHRGISPRLVEAIFEQIAEDRVKKPKAVYKVDVTFLEIYNEQVKDLFAKNKNSEYAQVKIRQHPIYGVQVHGLEAKTVDTAEQCKIEMEHGISQRALASTKMNATSSRSHAIFQIHIFNSQTDTKQRGHATINLVDLAGSERIGKTGATGQTADEAKMINLSLSTLRKVIDTLIDNSKGAKKVPPYRESMLTWVLKDSLGGNSKTMMICTISPHADNLEDTVSTLRYGLKAKAIVCKAVKQSVTADRQATELRKQIADLEEALRSAREGGLDSDEAKEQAKELQEMLDVERQELHHVQHDLQMMQEREIELQHEVRNERNNKFASAFRSAFVLEKGKKESKELMEKLAAEKESLQQESTMLHGQIQESRKKFEEEEAEMKKRLAQEAEERKNLEERTTKMTHALLTEIGIELSNIAGDPSSVAHDEVIRKFQELQDKLNSETITRRSLQKEVELLQQQQNLQANEFDQLNHQVELQQVMHRKEADSMEDMLERERATTRSAWEEAQRSDAHHRNEMRMAQKRFEDELEAVRGRLEAEKQHMALKIDEQSKVMDAAEDELADLRKLVKALQAELYIAEQTVNDLNHRKDHYKKQCILLREMHEADTNIIKSLSNERNLTSDVVAAAVTNMRSPDIELGDKARILQPILDDKADTICRLTGALGDYQEAAAEWMSSPAVVGPGTRNRREQRARDKLSVWLQEGQPVNNGHPGRGRSASPGNSHRSPSLKKQARPPDPGAIASYLTWQSSPFGVSSSSDRYRPRSVSPSAGRHRSYH
ncbi:Kinesin-related protein 1 [Diplonema papillatum]|nr:Kinesin-related protein 1 [Diplonema papillatum]